MEGNFKVAIKVDGKWFNVGMVKKSEKYDNYGLSLKDSNELRAHLKAKTGDWSNFSMFPDKPKEQKDSDSPPF